TPYFPGFSWGECQDRSCRLVPIEGHLLAAAYRSSRHVPELMRPERVTSALGPSQAALRQSRCARQPPDTLSYRTLLPRSVRHGPGRSRCSGAPLGSLNEPSPEDAAEANLPSAFTVCNQTSLMGASPPVKNRGTMQR